MKSSLTLVAGGTQQNQNSNQSGGGGAGYGNNSDLSGAAQQAQQHAGSSGDESIFSSVLSHLTSSNVNANDLDEQGSVQAHQAMYGQGGQQQQQPHDSNTMGAAAAMQALKLFTGGGSGQQGQGSQGGGNSQSQFVGMAMAQASKLFDGQAAAGNVSQDASKQDVVSKAGEMAMKMYIKSQMSGGGGGGPGGLMGMASKFLM